MKRLLLWTFACLLVGMLGPPLTQVRADCPPSSPQCNPAPPTPQANPGASTDGPSLGVEGAIAEPPLRNKNSPLLYEQFRTSAYLPLNVDTGATIFTAITDPRKAGQMIGTNLSASLLMANTLAVGILSLRLLGWSIHANPLAGTDTSLDSLVAATVKGTYQPLLEIVIILLAFWFLWTSIVKGEHRRGMQGLLWALFVVVLSGVFFQSPSSVLDGASTISNGLSRGILEVVGDADTKIWHPNDPAVKLGPADDGEVRLFSNRYWVSFVYTPWTNAEFGTPDPKTKDGNQLGVELLQKQSGQPSKFDQDIKEQPQQVRDWFAGGSGDQRFVIALISLATSLLAAFLFLWVSAVRLLKSLQILLLLAIFTPVLLVSFHPSAGKDGLQRWFLALFGAFWGTVIWTLLLAMMMVAVDVSSLAAGTNGWLAVSVSELIGMAAVLLLRNSVFGIISSFAHPSLRHDHIGESQIAERTHEALGRGHDSLTESVGRIGSEAAMGGVMARLGGGALLGGGAVAGGGAVLEAGAASAGAGAAAGAAGTAAGGMALGLGTVATGGALLAAAGALKGAQIAVKGAEHGKRQLQGKVGEFLIPHANGSPSPTGYDSGGYEGWSQFQQLRQRVKQRRQDGNGTPEVALDSGVGPVLLSPGPDGGTPHGLQPVPQIVPPIASTDLSWKSENCQHEMEISHDGSREHCKRCGMIAWLSAA